MNRRSILNVALLLGVALPLAACDEGATSPSAGAETTILLNRSGSASAALEPSYSAALLALAGPVSVSDVKSINVTVTEVQALRLDAGSLPDTAVADTTASDTTAAGGEDDESEEEGRWVSFKVTAPTTINLLALPTTADAGLQLASGDIEPGTYGRLRIVFSEANVTFARDVRVGGGPMAKTYAADSTYTLLVGGGERNTIMVPTGGFTVGTDSATAVLVTFDGAASVRKVIATPKGIRMTPVLFAREKGDEAEAGNGAAAGKGKGKGKG